MSKILTTLLLSIMTVIIALEMAPLDIVRTPASIIGPPPNDIIFRQHAIKPFHVKDTNQEFKVESGGFTVKDAHFKVEKANFIVKDLKNVKLANPGFKFKE